MSEAVYFEKFCTDLLVGTTKRSTISARYLAICTRLNKDFWNGILGFLFPNDRFILDSFAEHYGKKLNILEVL